MNVAIFGATGPTGQHLVAQALNAGHKVTVLARTPEKLGQTHPNLKVVQGNVLDRRAVEQVTQGQDVVLCALGVRKLGKNTTVSQGTRYIVEAMAEQGTGRFICITSVGVGESRAQARTMGVVFNRFLLPMLLANPFADKEVQEQVIQRSAIDWLIVRPASLTNDSVTGKYRVTDAQDFAISGKVSRADVAHFMLAQAQTPHYHQRAVTLSY